MAQQARSEATRRKILTAAVELFDENGYTTAGLGEIIERTELTKGAFYYHFDSKESLAEAIIADAAALVLNSVITVNQSASPALENVIHSSFVVAGTLTGDPLARVGSQLMRALGRFNATAAHPYGGMVAVITHQIAQAGAEGDLRPDVDAEAVGEVFVSTFLGAELLSISMSAGHDMTRRLKRAWSLLLPAITDDSALPYFREFLERETLRTPD